MSFLLHHRGHLHDHFLGSACRNCGGRKTVTSYSWQLVEGRLVPGGRVTCPRCNGVGSDIKLGK
jgi:hypothetical protein